MSAKKLFLVRLIMLNGTATAAGSLVINTRGRSNAVEPYSVPCNVGDTSWPMTGALQAVLMAAGYQAPNYSRYPLFASEVPSYTLDGYTAPLYPLATNVTVLPAGVTAFTQHLLLELDAERLIADVSRRDSTRAAATLFGAFAGLLL